MLLQELDNLFDNSISLIKAVLKDYSLDMTPENVNELLRTLEEDLLNSSFLKFDDSQTASENFKCYSSDFILTEPLDELERYYSVGTALEGDPCVLNLLAELGKLHTDHLRISPYSVIIGPSYMGKTQTTCS